MADITRRQQPPPRVYQVIETGNDYIREYEDQAGIPVDGSTEDGRKQSPFVIRVVPPSILGSAVVSGNAEGFRRRRYTIEGGEVQSVPSQEAVFGQICSIVSGSGAEERLEVVDSLTPLSFIGQFHDNGTLNCNPNLSQAELDALSLGGTAFGAWRSGGLDGQGRQHPGVDIYVPPGSPVYTPFEARVLSIGWDAGYRTPPDTQPCHLDQGGDGGYGQGITLQSVENPNVVTRLLHCREINPAIQRGQVYPAGTQLCVSYTPANFPECDPSHLHVEARTDGSTSSGNVNAFTVYDVSRLFYPAGFGNEAAQGGAGGAVVVPTEDSVLIETQVEQTLNTGIVAAASDAFRSADTFLRFEDYLRNGLQQAITGRSFQRLQEIVNGSGDRVTPQDSGLGAPAITTERVAADILLQVINMTRLPPLQFLVNPSEFSLQLRKIQQFSEKTRNGYIHQAWGEEQEIISISGNFGAYLSSRGETLGLNNPTAGITRASGGNQFASKRDSAAFQQLMNLMSLYRNSGYIFDTLSGSSVYHMIGNIAIDYDGWTYVGHFNSIEWGYQDDKMNGGMEFSAEFTVSRKFEYAPNNTIVNPYTDPNGQPTQSFREAIGARNAQGGTVGVPQGLGASIQPAVDTLVPSGLPPEGVPLGSLGFTGGEDAPGSVNVTEALNQVNQGGASVSSSSFDTDQPYGI